LDVSISLVLIYTNAKYLNIVRLQDSWQMRMGLR
jgi:hypothetical protein